MTRKTGKTQRNARREFKPAGLCAWRAALCTAWAVLAGCQTGGPAAVEERGANGESLAGSFQLASASEAKASGAVSRETVAQRAAGWPVHELSAEGRWLLDPPKGERFDASGLLWRQQQLLTVNDRGARLYVIGLSENGKGRLNWIPQWFAEKDLAEFRAEKHGRFDCEGIAGDAEGTLFLCEEGDRWILRQKEGEEKVERLGIDWGDARAYFSTDSNASWEGIAVGGGRLYAANEREEARVIEVDLKTLKATRSWGPRPLGADEGAVAYSDLCWSEGALYVLVRTHQCILRVDPETGAVTAQYDFGRMERESGVAMSGLHGVGTMEGLAVEPDAFWLISDNNGVGRLGNPMDARPMLFRCARPK